MSDFDATEAFIKEHGFDPWKTEGEYDRDTPFRTTKDQHGHGTTIRIDCPPWLAAAVDILCAMQCQAVPFKSRDRFALDCLYHGARYYQSKVNDPDVAEKLTLEWHQSVQEQFRAQSDAEQDYVDTTEAVCDELFRRGDPMYYKSLAAAFDALPNITQPVLRARLEALLNRHRYDPEQ